MRKVISMILALVMVLGIACVHAEDNNTPVLGGNNLVGGWAPAEDPAITDEVNELVAKAMEGLVGVNYVPVAYLGSQVVAGTNHAILCQATVVVPNAAPSWKILFLYEDLQGNVSVLSIADFDFGALCEY